MADLGVAHRAANVAWGVVRFCRHRESTRHAAVAAPPPPSRVQALCCRSGSLQRDGRDSHERAVALVLNLSPQGRQIPERYLAREALGNFQQHPKTAILCSGPGGGTSIHLISHQDCWRDRAPVRASSLAEGFGGSLMEAIEGPCFAIAGPPNHDTEASTGISN